MIWPRSPGPTAMSSSPLSSKISWLPAVLAAEVKPLSDAKLVITDADGKQREVPVTLRIDTAIEVDYYHHGGILPFVLRQLLAA